MQLQWFEWLVQTVNLFMWSGVVSMQVFCSTIGWMWMSWQACCCLMSQVTYRLEYEWKPWLMPLFRHHHHHHHISVMQLGHLLTRSSLTYPEFSSNIYHSSFCQLQNCVSLPWAIYYKAFYLHVVSSFSFIPVICPELVLFLIPL